MIQQRKLKPHAKLRGMFEDKIGVQIDLDKLKTY